MTATQLHTLHIESPHIMTIVLTMQMFTKPATLYTVLNLNSKNDKALESECFLIFLQD